MADRRPDLSRRAVIGATAWSVPVITLATAAPAHAASGPLTLQRSAPTSPIFATNTLTGTRDVAVTVLANGTTPTAGEVVTFTISPANTSWVVFDSTSSTIATAASGTGGIASSPLRYQGSATAGDSATVTATLGASTVSWTLYYVPLRASLLGAGAVHTLRGTNRTAWGRNVEGQLGNGSINGSALPVAVSAGTIPAGVTLSRLSGGASHSVALGSEGAIYGWGNNGSGQLTNAVAGAGSTTPITCSLTTIPAATTIVQVVAGNNYTAALGSDGVVYSWGGNQAGQLGNGSTTASSVPVSNVQGQIPLGVRIVAIAVASGGLHTLALGEDGKVYAWGGGFAGKLGDGAGADRTSPVAALPGAIPAGVRITSVAAGGNHSIAIGDDDNVYTSGYGPFGQLGNARNGSQAVPVQMILPAGVTFVAATGGSDNTFVLGQNGQVYSTGYNGDGELGDGTNASSRNTPVAVALPGGISITTIASGTGHTVATATNGSTYAWGFNSNGQVGDGQTGRRATATARLSSAEAPLRRCPNVAAPTSGVVGCRHGTVVAAYPPRDRGRPRHLPHAPPRLARLARAA